MLKDKTLNAANLDEMRVRQTENADISYTINWAAELDTDTISTSTWSSENRGLTIAGESNTTTQATARLTADAGRYRVVNKVVTVAGDTQERYIDLSVLDNSGYVWDYWNSEYRFFPW
jgi:hypothetical protein